MRRSYYLYRSAAALRAAMREVAAVPGAAPELVEGMPHASVMNEAVASRYRGFSYLAPVVCMSKYLAWLTGRLSSLGVALDPAVLASLGDVDALRSRYRADIVVNCLALGSREVFGDDAMHGVIGDLVYVRAPAIEERANFACVSDEEHPQGLAYAVPQCDGIVALAGTAVAEAAAAGSAADERRRGILLRCREVFGMDLAGGDVVGFWSGLRPQRRGGIRLELDRGAAAAPLIHNYGHGGSGVMLSWGCAREVARLAGAAAEGAGVRLVMRKLPEDLRTAARAAAIGAAGTARL